MKATSPEEAFNVPTHKFFLAIFLLLFLLIGTQLYLAEWFIWPPAQFINFYFLPTRFRVVYDNVISLGYDMYTSHVKNSKSTSSENRKMILFSDEGQVVESEDNYNTEIGE